MIDSQKSLLLDIFILTKFMVLKCVQVGFVCQTGRHQLEKHVGLQAGESKTIQMMSPNSPMRSKVLELISYPNHMLKILQEKIFGGR